MSRPVMIGAGVCGLLLVGLVVRPTFWSGGGEGGAETAALAAVSNGPRGLRPVDEFPQLSRVELQREADNIWRRAVEVQGQLHREPPAEQRELLLAQLEDLVDRSNAVQELLDSP